MSDDVPMDVTEAAGDWVDRLSGDASADDRRAFAEWLLRSPVHVEEFLRIGALRRELKDALQSEDWVADALAQADALVVEMPGRTARRQRARRRPTPRQWLAVAASVVAASVLAWVAWLAPWGASPDRVTVATAVGEQRFMPLSDGSTVTINTDSLVDIRIGPTTREIVLQRGEVLLDVAEDPSRPFRVTSGDVTVEAVATRFSVYRRAEDTLVAVVEGRVAIDWRPVSQGVTPVELRPNDQSFELGAGQQVALGSVQPIAPTPVDPEKVTAWTKQRVVFENEPLEAVVAEFNRYNRTNLRLGDPALAQRRITGSFDVNDLDHFIDVLDGLEPIRVEVADDGHRALHSERER